MIENSIKYVYTFGIGSHKLLIMENNIKKSFDKLIQLYNKQDEEETVPDYFCDKECFDKFIRILQKIKRNDIDLDNLNFSDDNFFSNLISHYYNKGHIHGYNSYLHK